MPSYNDELANAFNAHLRDFCAANNKRGNLLDKARGLAKHPLASSTGPTHSQWMELREGIWALYPRDQIERDALHADIFWEYQRAFKEHKP